jgi:hypothetical protein
MTGISIRSRAVVVVALIATSSCGGPTRTAAGPATPRTSVAVGAGRPSLTVVERDGDARGAVAIAVTTDGIAPDRGAVVGVALGSLVEERLAARGIVEASAAGGWDGWRLRSSVASPADGARLVQIAREAMLEPVGPKDPALAAVARKVEALAHRPLPDRALADMARCTGEAYGIGNEATPSALELDAWRRAAHGLGRVAVATAGDAALADAVAAALANAPTWPAATPVVASPSPTADAPAIVYDASGEIPPGGARIIVTARTNTPEQAVASAPVLGDSRGPLASRLAALDAPGRLRSVVATAHVDGGCLAATIDLSPRDIASDTAGRIATAAALARQELAVEISDVATPRDLRRALAMRAADPRDAAERAAWWALSRQRQGRDEIIPTVTVGVAATRDPPEPAVGSNPRRPGPHTTPAIADTIRAEIDRATIAWREPVVEGRTRVERGQGEAWVLVASSCGTLPEAGHDAGVGAVMATAAAMRAADETSDARVEPLVLADGVGVLAHGPARPGESPQAHARRLADVAGRAFAADALDAEHMGRARTALLTRAGELDARALAALGGALYPGHPSWLDPWGTNSGLGSASDSAIAMRAAAIRAGPLRVAVLANVDSAQADAAIRAVDRWVARRPGETRTCPALPTLAPPRSGTYAVEVPSKGLSEALLALPLPAGDEPTRAAAAWVAAALDGPSGMLARAVGGAARGDASGSPLTRAWSVAVLGAPHAAALVIRLVAPDTSLDASVAQARAMLDRLHQGAFREEDRARAAVALSRALMAASVEPRERAIHVWRGGRPFVTGPDRVSSAESGAEPSAPSLETLRAFASTELRDDALIIVAARPAHGDSDRPAGREAKGPSRESNRQ